MMKSLKSDLCIIVPVGHTPYGTNKTTIYSQSSRLPSSSHPIRQKSQNATLELEEVPAGSATGNRA